MTDTERSEDTDGYTDEIATFGDRVTAARETLSMTRAQLARRLGIKPQTLQNWEEDRSEPRANKLQMLAGMLNVSIIWLMSGQGEGPDETELAPNHTQLLAELREVTNAQLMLANRLKRLETKLRNALS